LRKRRTSWSTFHGTNPLPQAQGSQAHPLQRFLGIHSLLPFIIYYPVRQMERARAQTRRLVGGAPCLDFANSVDWDSEGRERPAHTEAFTAPAELARWGARLGLAPATITPLVHGRELAEARSLRRTIHSLFAAIASDRAPAADAIAQLEEDYTEAIGAAQLTVGDDGWRLDWPEGDPRRIRFAVAVNAFDLLRDDKQLARVRICPGNNCGWLFLDTTGRRRWCSMDVCGSRSKMRRLYERQRQSRDVSKAEPRI
jgi:predicted RNA-binding Zn ribbon-like protein